MRQSIIGLRAVWLIGCAAAMAAQAAQIKAHFPAVVENNTVNDRLVAMPWFIDAPMLYYRR